MKVRFLALFFALLVMGAGCKGLSAQDQAAVKPVQLEWWTVFDDIDGMRNLAKQYTARYPHITVTVRRFTIDEYQKELINALAEDRAPDIVSLEHTWVPEYQSKLAEQPAQVTIPHIIFKQTNDITGQAKQEVQSVEYENTKLYTPRKLRDTFVGAVGDDVIAPNNAGEEAIYAYPLSMDTLQMFYNRDILDKAGIAEPPKTWDDFTKSVAKLRKIDPATGAITQAAAGLARADNIDRASDIVLLLMMQNGAIVKDAFGHPNFDSTPPGLGQRSMPPGPEALAFYTDFANPAKNEVYTWNEKLPNSFDMFARGSLAYFFGYSYHIGQLQEERALKVNYGVAPVPQLNAESVHFANYWVQAVTKKSKHPNEAWHFLYFTTLEANNMAYLKKTVRPTALRSLVKKQLEDETFETIYPFIQGVLTAKSWYNGRDAQSAERVILSMIRRVNEKSFESNAGNIYIVAVQDAVHQVESTR